MAALYGDGVRRVNGAEPQKTEGRTQPRGVPAFPRCFANALVDKAHPSQTAAFSLGCWAASVACAAAAAPSPGATTMPGAKTSRSRRRGCGGWKARRAWTSQ